MRPYIGVTGFKSPAQITAALQEYSTKPSSANLYQLMVGVLVSYKTWRGRSVSKRYPPVADIADLLPEPTRDILSLIHFNSREPDFVSDLAAMIELWGPKLDGFQLNIRWPDPKQLESFRQQGHAQIIVLQVGPQALKAVDNDPIKLTQKLQDYKGLVDYVLLDASGGRGTKLDLCKTHKHLTQIYSARLNDYISFGVAGGFCGRNVMKVWPLLKEFGPLALDAEGKLHDKRTGEMDICEVTHYIHMALNVV